MINNFIEQTLLGVILGLSFGIGIHDTHIDKATMVAMTPPQQSHLVSETAQISTHFHTHVERASFGDVLQMENANPHRHARFRERKHLKNKHHQTGGRLTPITRPV